MCSAHTPFFSEYPNTNGVEWDSSKDFLRVIKGGSLSLEGEFRGMLIEPGTCGSSKKTIRGGPDPGGRKV